MDEKKPSEVFLALWYSRISGQVISREESFALAETWAEIRRMEGTTPQTPPAPAPLTQGSREAESTPEDVQKVHPDRVEKVHGDRAKSGEKDPSPACAPVRDDSALDGCEVVQNGPDPAKSAAAAAGMANRKRNDMARLEALRARGVSMQTVAESAAGLTLNDVLDFMDRKPIQLPKLVALEKAMKKLEAGA
ncbi:MAG: hypothetical protein IJH47_00185 [Oscillospiraceae bacterium]|nr:hypothetical protein [Oscillospiraceae bacterium]